MSFLKKHWRFAVLPIIALCALLAVVVLYGTGEKPNPTRVYTMPERSPDNSPPINTGGVSLSPASVSSASVATTASTTPTAKTETLTTKDEGLETCCPEEASQFAQLSPGGSDSVVVHVPDADSRRHAEYYDAWQTYREKERKLEADHHTLLMEASDVLSSRPTFSTPQQVAEYFSSMTPEEKEQNNKFWASWRSRLQDLTQRETQLVREKPIEPISTHQP